MYPIMYHVFYSYILSIINHLCEARDKNMMKYQTLQFDQIVFRNIKLVFKLGFYVVNV